MGASGEAKRGKRLLALFAVATAVLIGAGTSGIIARAGTYTGSITSTDPSHTNFENFAAGGPSACGATPASPGVISDSSSYHYETISETNSSGTAQCATVSVGSVSGGFGVAVYAYLGSFDPTSLSSHYAGGYNSQIPVGGSGSFGVTVPAGQTLVVEVEEYVAGAGAQYTATISGLDQAPPVITSADHTTFQVGSAGSFTVTTTAGVPAATTVTETGSLPSGVSFTDNGDGTATLQGTPANGTGGTYPLTITASNGVLPNATQSFTLTVKAPLAAPGLDTTAIATHHRKVEWSISKLVDGKSSESFNQATPATLHYSVALTKTVDYDAYSVTGDITATNTNPDPLSVTISEMGLAPAVSGSSCTLDLTGKPTSVRVTLDAGSVSTPGTYTVSYTCTFTTAPDAQTEYTNQASVTYDSGNAEVDALSDLFSFPAATEDGAPGSVTVTDANAPAAAGFPKTVSDSATYTYTQSVFSDPCTQFTNTATITETGQSSSTSVAFCGAKGLLSNLLSYVNGLPPGTSLPSKVQTAINYYNAHDIPDTCKALSAVINQAKAVSGKKITKTQANTVIAMAKQIQAVIGC